MKIKFGGARKIVYALLILVIIVLLFKRVSGYTLSPSIESSPLKLTTKIGDDESMTSLPYKLECVPGPQESASPYTKSLTPGGYCGIQEFVKAHADYKITGGIGESLLD
jgi:hypothetical protein